MVKEISVKLKCLGVERRKKRKRKMPKEVNKKIDKIFKRLEEQDRKIYLMNEEITSLKQRLRNKL